MVSVASEAAAAVVIVLGLLIFDHLYSFLAKGVSSPLYNDCRFVSQTSSLHASQPSHDLQPNSKIRGVIMSQLSNHHGAIVTEALPVSRGSHRQVPSTVHWSLTRPPYNSHITSLILRTALTPKNPTVIISRPSIYSQLCRILLYLSHSDDRNEESTIHPASHPPTK